MTIRRMFKLEVDEPKVDVTIHYNVDYGGEATIVVKRHKEVGPPDTVWVEVPCAALIQFARGPARDALRREMIAVLEEVE